MNDSAFHVELAIRTRQIAKMALDIDGGYAHVIGAQLAEIMQQIFEVKELLKKAGKL